MQEIPTIQQLKDNIKNDFKTKLNLSVSDLKYVLDVFDGVLAAQFSLAYQFLRDIQDNAFPDTATSELNGGTLERFGRIRLSRNPRPQTAGVFKIQVTGSIGADLRANLTFKSNEDSLNAGKLYILDTLIILSSTSEEIETRSIGGGIEFNLKIGDKLTVTEPVLGLDNTVEVVEIIEQPLSSEDIEDYRAEILRSYQIEPQGGSRGDYRLWADDAQGVRLVYPYTKNVDSGEVDVYVEATKAMIPLKTLNNAGLDARHVADRAFDVERTYAENSKFRGMYGSYAPDHSISTHSNNSASNGKELVAVEAKEDILLPDEFQVDTLAMIALVNEGKR